MKFVRRYLIPRLLQYVLVNILGITMIFILPRLMPSGPVEKAVIQIQSQGANIDPKAAQETVRALKELYGLDQPLINQYFMWMGRTLTGDLGRSNKTQRPVIDELKDRLPVTLELGIFSWLFSIIIAIPAGIENQASDNRQAGLADRRLDRVEDRDGALEGRPPAVRGYARHDARAVREHLLRVEAAGGAE